MPDLWICMCHQYIWRRYLEKSTEVCFTGVLYLSNSVSFFFCKLKISVPLIWFLPSMLVVHLFERQKVTLCVESDLFNYLISALIMDSIMPCTDGLQRPQRMPSEIRREPWEICKHTLDSCIKALLSICVSKQQFQVKLAPLTRTQSNIMCQTFTMEALWMRWEPTRSFVEQTTSLSAWGL